MIVLPLQIRLSAVFAAAISLVLSGCSGTTGGTAAAPAAMPGTLGLTATAATVAQAAGTATISVSRTGGTTGAVSVAYATSDVTAVAGTDYVRSTGTLTWSDGDASAKSLTVSLTTVPGFTGSRTFALALSSPTGSASLGTAGEVVTITGTGAPGTIALSGASFSLPQSAGSVPISVTRTGGSTGAVSVAYSTANASATAGTDYTATAGTLTWADGDTAAKTFSVPVATTPSFAGARTFSVMLGTPTLGATLGASLGVVTINGSGAPGTVGLAASTLAVVQAAGTATFSLQRTGGSTGAVSVSYATSNGTAIAGTDYTAASGSVTWANGDAAAKTVSVPLASTPFFAGTKTFTLTVSAPTGGATLGTASSLATVTGTLLPPANYFSFSGTGYTWKVQLPVDQFGGTGGTNGIQYASIEESNSQINAGFVDPYFYADTATYGGASKHVIFTAPSNGAVTTPGTGSDHTRSELRELYNGVGADSSGDWNSAIGGTLTASCVVNSVSAGSDIATIGQIHNQSYVFVLLIYRPGSKDVAFDIYSTYGGSAHTRTSLVSNVNLGDTINYQINYVASSITVTVNGVTKVFAVDPSWAGTPMYFKAGAYHSVNNTGNPAGDQTQVAFSSFAVSH